jgi:polysaccharide export outer membrane protein
MYRTFCTITAIFSIWLLSSCSAPRKTIYFNQASSSIDTSIPNQALAPVPESRVLPDDILAINVTTISDLDPRAQGKLFNDGGTPFIIAPMTGGGSSGGGAVGQANGYLVDADGFISFPVIGKIKVTGYTTKELKGIMAAKLKDYIKDPVVEVRIINYKITIFGEVSRPGTIIAPNQRISILEAIATAGDIPVTGRKDNVLVVRETNGQREYARLNLNSRDVFNSPFFYLRQNDVVYVEANRVRRQESNDFLRIYLPTITTLLTAVVSLYTVIRLTQ